MLGYHIYLDHPFVFLDWDYFLLSLFNFCSHVGVETTHPFPLEHFLFYQNPKYALMRVESHRVEPITVLS